MAPRTLGRRLTTPAKRIRGSAEGYFFPNEVVRMLSLQRLDYRQLRRLFRLVAISRGEVMPRKWARFTFQDLASLRAAIHALGGAEAVATAKRLPLKRLEQACTRLREDYGLTNPLTQARLAWDGHGVVVQLHGARFEPDSRQLLLRLSDRLAKHLDYAAATPTEKRALKPRVVAETRRVEQHGQRRTRPVLATALDPCLRFGRGQRRMP
jgi:hypothetical protein